MGRAYLIIEKTKSEAYKYFGGISKSFRQFVLSRDPPANLKKYFTPACEFLWLTNVTQDNICIRPQELEQLSYTIEMFIKNNKKSAVLITGVEFIESYTSFDQTLHFIQSLRDLAVVNDCILIVNIGENTLDEKEKSLLEQELELIILK